MKIAYIYPALNTIGGADRVITDKANYFAEHYGYEVYIITAHQGNHPLFFKLSDKVKHIDLDVNFNKQYHHTFFKRGFIYFKLLHQYKRKLSALLLSLKLDITITTISRDIDFLYKLKDGSKKIAEAHVSKEYVRNFHLLENKGFLYRAILKIWRQKLENAIRKFDRLVVLTDNDAAHWSKVREAVVIPNSTPFYPENFSDCSGNKIISVGRLYAQKGYDLLIYAWELVHKLHPGWTMHIYGNGEDKEKLQQLINSRNLNNSFFLEVPVTNIAEKYIESSFYVMSSRFEGFGMVLIEAMACGLPVISFDCPDGPSDIITDGEDGFLVENANIGKLADKICCLIDDKALRAKMGLTARENVKRYFPDVIMQKWIDLFETLNNESVKT